MHEFGTTSEQLAWIKVAASHHAQHNPHAMLRDVVTVQDVLDSPMIADPLHRLDCCVVSDGGGALIVARPEIASSLKRPLVKVIGSGEAVAPRRRGRASTSRPPALRCRAPPRSPKPASSRPTSSTRSIYDSFTITVLLQIEDLGFCKKGEGGRFVADGNLISGVGQAAVQHRRRRPVQQPPGQPRRHHQGDRGGAPVARRGAPGGAGQELRPRARAGHRRQPGQPARQFDRDSRTGVMTAMNTKTRVLPSPGATSRQRSLRRCCARGPLHAALLRRLRPHALVPARGVSALHEQPDAVEAGQRPRHGVLVFDDATRRSALHAGLRHARRRPDDADQPGRQRAGFAIASACRCGCASRPAKTARRCRCSGRSHDNHPRCGLAAARHALAELGRFARRSGLRRQTLTSTLTPSRGQHQRTGKAGSAVFAWRPRPLRCLCASGRRPHGVARPCCLSRG